VREWEREGEKVQRLEIDCAMNMNMNIVPLKNEIV
jgi:hypothetical protein